MRKEILESTKYVSKLYFFLGSSLMIPFSLRMLNWLLSNEYHFNFDIKFVLDLLLAIIGIYIIKFGCRELVVEEERIGIR